MHNNLHKIQKRALQYEMVDGVYEIALGFWMILIGMSFYFRSFCLPKSMHYIIGVFAIQPGLVLAMILLMYAAKVVKKHLTHPRTGFVQPKKPSQRLQIGLLTFFTILLIFTMILVPFASPDSLMSWLTFAGGVGFSLAWLYTAWRTGLQRLYLLAGISLILGMLLPIANSGSSSMGFIYLNLGEGILMVISGCYALITYLRSTSQPTSIA